MGLMSKILFALFLGSWLLSIFFFYRFYKVVGSSGLLSEKELEALSLLLLSGDGRAKDEKSALQYLLSRKYATLNNAEVTQAGDVARDSWYVTFALMVLCGISWMLFNW